MAALASIPGRRCVHASVVQTMSLPSKAYTPRWCYRYVHWEASYLLDALWADPGLAPYFETILLQMRDDCLSNKTLDMSSTSYATLSMMMLMKMKMKMKMKMIIIIITIIIMMLMMMIKNVACNINSCEVNTNVTPRNMSKLTLCLVLYLRSGLSRKLGYLLQIEHPLTGCAALRITEASSLQAVQHSHYSRTSMQL
eukprot:4739568-Amphidinium_carterae.1